jgi:hypothetical protein
MKTNTGFYLEQHLFDWLKKKAKADGRSVSGMLNHILSQLVQSEENGK